MDQAHDSPSPSPSAWVRRFAAGLPDGEVLDLACGSGRHARLLAERGHAVLAVDRDPSMLMRADIAGVSCLAVDLENDGAAWPPGLFAAGRYGGVIVTNYLHRPLLPLLFASLAEGGLLIYETFAFGNERFGKPSNPDFLLLPGELLAAALVQRAHGVHVLAFEEGYVGAPKPAMVQRLCAVRGVPAWGQSFRLD